MVKKYTKKKGNKTKDNLFGMNKKETELFELKEENRKLKRDNIERKIGLEQAGYILLVFGLLYIFRDHGSSVIIGIIVGACCVGGLLHTSRWEE